MIKMDILNLLNNIQKYLINKYQYLIYIIFNFNSNVVISMDLYMVFIPLVTYNHLYILNIKNLINIFYHHLLI